VNAYEVKAGMVFIAGKLCDPCLSALKWFVYHARRYTSALLYLYLTLLRCLWHKSEEKGTCPTRFWSGDGCAVYVLRFSSHLAMDLLDGYIL